jgi:hypothetical protein
MGFNGMVLDGVLTPTDQDTVYLSSTKGHLRVDSVGGIKYAGGFWHKERDFFGYIMLDSKPSVEKFLVPDGFSYDLGVRFIERTTVTLYSDAFTVQELFQTAYLEDNVGLEVLVKEARSAEPGMVATCCSLPGHEADFDMDKYPHLGEVLRAKAPAFTIERGHTIVGVDPHMFASLDTSISASTITNGFGSSPHPYFSSKVASINAHKRTHPEITRISFTDPVVQHIPYQGLVLRKPSKAPKEEFAKAMKDAGFTYQRSTYIQPNTTYNTLERIADMLPTSHSHGRIELNSHSRYLMEQLHHQPGPAIVVADTPLGSLLAQVGRFPTFLNGDPDLLFYGPSTYSYVSAEGMLGHPLDLLLNARLAEGELLVGLSAALGAELWCSDVNLHDNKTDSITHTIKNIGRGMADWYPISVFSPQGEKFRSPVLEGLNEDSFLF